MQTTEGFINVSGGKIFYRSFGEIDSNNPPLIAVHGGPGFCHDTFEVLAPLAEKRCLILYDQLGCGRSDRSLDKSLWSVEYYATELTEIANHFNLTAYHVLGHSFGASVALDYSLKQPTGLQRLILSSPLISVKDWLADTNIRKKTLPESVQTAIDKHEAANSTNSDEYKQAVEVFNRHFLCRLNPKPAIYQNALKKFNLDLYQTMWGPSEFSCTGTLSSYNRATELDKLTIPTLLLCGEQDEIRPETLTRYLQQLPDGSQLHVFPDCAHGTYLEATDNFIDAVDQFLTA